MCVHEEICKLFSIFDNFDSFLLSLYACLFVIQHNIHYSISAVIFMMLLQKRIFCLNFQQRYLSFHSGFGSRFMNGEASLEECEEQMKKQNSEVTATSGRPEHWETVFCRYIEQSK